MANKTKITDSLRNAARTLRPAREAAAAQRKARRDAAARARREAIAHYASTLTPREQALVRYRTENPGIAVKDLALLLGISTETVARDLKLPRVVEAFRRLNRSAMEAIQEGQLEAVEVLTALLRSRNEATRLRAATVMVWPLVRKPVDPGGEENALARAIQAAYDEVRLLGAGRASGPMGDASPSARGPADAIDVVAEAVDDGRAASA